MGDATYLLRKVGLEEYKTLKEKEQDIINSVHLNFNDLWLPKVQKIKATFKYNPSREAIGIFIEREGNLQLIIERFNNGLSEEEKAVIYGLNRELERRLEKMRLPNEEWI